MKAINTILLNHEHDDSLYIFKCGVDLPIYSGNVWDFIRNHREKFEAESDNFEVVSVQDNGKFIYILLNWGRGNTN